MCIDGIARVVHEALRAFRLACGESRVPPWDGVQPGYRQSMLEAVRGEMSPAELTTFVGGDQLKVKLLAGVITSLKDFQ